MRLGVWTRQTAKAALDQGSQTFGALLHICCVLSEEAALTDSTILDRDFSLRPFVIRATPSFPTSCWRNTVAVFLTSGLSSDNTTSFRLRFQ